MFAERTNWNLTPNRLSEALAQHLAGGKRLYDLSASNPTEVGFSYDHETILHALCDPNALTYVPDPKGLVRARQGVAEYYADRGNEVSVEDIILTASTSEAYSFVFRALCNPGDELLVPAPSYPLFGFLAGIHDVTLAHYPLVYDHGWQVDLPSVEKAITPRTRGIIVVNPNNPTGHFVKPEELAALNAICSARDMALIADEVFLDFAHVDFNGRRELGKVRPRAANGGRPHVYDERIVEDCGIATDEGRLAGCQRAGAAQEAGCREDRSHRGHLSIHERAYTIGAAHFPGAAAWISETGADAGAAKCWGAGPAAHAA
jgi:hypothetical protein